MSICGGSLLHAIFIIPMMSCILVLKGALCPDTYIFIHYIYIYIYVYIYIHILNDFYFYDSPAVSFNGQKEPSTMESSLMAWIPNIPSHQNTLGGGFIMAVPGWGDQKGTGVGVVGVAIGRFLGVKGRLTSRDA